ncbi:MULTISPECIES: HlyD family secretion protein [unclassified Vibrio]|uniref:HlyD family secretion protein n=1 Tax=unclassified Vibrio TaxID=2614977 RepID=UPI001361CAC5|nr:MULTISPECIES: HlyD family secretion protein [unclassified Vibrio]NAW57456.1 HlyD family efflux transporter periplasmic adaptor subunit [Vibrio sp. V36_P2S2PM302]NAX27143.1 HlyD family efflux transporter periplasmic adaptor subunit [Vibrio sp. V38_P2S17PM301]NAX30300.1 HlyD family efflux transporter periplasmic adaptor subunit [Vibrio sp. V37_P2S8PM304]
MSQPVTTNPEASQLAPKNHKKKRLMLLLVVPAIAIAASVGIYMHGGRYVETDNAYVKADKTLINAEVSGRIINVPVDENQPVKAGDLLFQIDPEPYEIAVAQAQANLKSTAVDLNTTKAEYDSKLANIDTSHSQLAYAKREEKRQANLKKNGYSSDSQYDAAHQKTLLMELEVNTLQKQLKQVEASYGGDIRAPIETNPHYKKAQADLAKAENDLKHVNVYAPADGVVSKVIEKGEYASPGTIAMVLVADSHLWVEANFTEKELTNIRQGQEVEINVDYAPDYTWHGKVASLSPATGAEFSVIPAQNATGNWVKITQRVPVRIQIEDAQDAPTLRAGLSAVVTVDTQHHRELSL